MAKKMRGFGGQWVGISENQSATSRVDIDVTSQGVEVVVHIQSFNPALPLAYFSFVAPTKGNTFFFVNSSLSYLDLKTGNNLNNSALDEIFQGDAYPKLISSNWTMMGNGQLRLRWKSDTPISGDILLHMNKSIQPTEIKALRIGSWTEFKEFANKLDAKSFAFRGQENSRWRLVTGYHRTNRANLFRFVREDIPALWRSFSGLNIKFFDLKDADQNGALVALAQHHGYPTPLLDWTYSPYVAAYFAFNDKSSLPSKKDATVRIYLLDRMAWRTDFLQLSTLAVPAPHFSLLEPLALNNPRLIPQQALMTVTNLADIESYVLEMGRIAGKNYLQAIDLPVAERDLVLKELRLMGITAASLFPGLDGTCQQLREEFFPKNS